MNEIVIKGKSFSREEIIDAGKRAIKKKKTILWIVSGALLVTGLFMFFVNLFSNHVDSETGEVIEASVQANIGGSVASLIALLVPAVILFVISMVGNDPYKAGEKTLAKHFPNPVGYDGRIIDILEGDKVIQMSKKPVSSFIIDSSRMMFQLYTGKYYSRIYTPDDLIDYEIRVDNEIVVTSKTKTKKGVGKAIAGGLLFGDAGAIAGAVAGNSKSSTTSVQKEIHHYSLALKVNDINKPSFITNIDSAELAEDVIATLDIISKHKIGEPAEMTDYRNPDISNKENGEIDKFTEIKKYKDLLDEGIITQEEFNDKKKEILG